MQRLLLVSFGGAVGTAARYLLTGWAAQAFTSPFPFGTLFVNLIGSFLIALIMQLALTTALLSETARMTLTVGVLGGFTTYSSFSYETLDAFRRSAWAAGLLNVAVTVVGCLCACVLGSWVGRALAAGALGAH